MDLYPKVQANGLLILICYIMEILHCLLFGVYKYLIYRFYISGEFVPWYFAKVQKLGFAVICIETYRSVTQKEMFCLNL